MPIPDVRSPSTSSPLSPRWIPFAVASGACAAFNGVFAKLTTTSLTTSWAAGLSHALGIRDDSRAVEILVRGSFFALNLLFNITMWALFTRALTLSPSTTRVAIINTSANFLITAVLGMLVFAEEVRGMWWGGAGMLVVGSVVIGRGVGGEGDGNGKGEGKRKGEGGVALVGREGEGREREREGEDEEGYRDEEGDDWKSLRSGASVEGKEEGEEYAVSGSSGGSGEEAKEEGSRYEGSESSDDARRKE